MLAQQQGLYSVSDESSWNGWLEAAGGHVLQSFEWGELKQGFGWRVERLACGTSEKIHAGVQVLYRTLLPGLTVAYVPRGPVFQNDEQGRMLLQGLGDRVRRRGAFLLKVEPDWRQGDGRETLLQKADFAPSTETIQPPATIQIDLTADPETILARMKPKWRYNIRLAEKKGVTVRAATKADMPVFYELMNLTAARDRFAIHGYGYYAAVFARLSAGDHARLFLADFDGRTLAAIFVTAYGSEAVYLYGASSNEERNRMPNHALHWAAIKWAKARGCERYDLWGVPETIGEESEAALPSSLYQFKQGFGGEVVRYTGAWDRVYARLHFRAYRAARRVRRGSMG